jgi:hypothetical protein
MTPTVECRQQRAGSEHRLQAEAQEPPEWVTMGGVAMVRDAPWILVGLLAHDLHAVESRLPPQVSSHGPRLVLLCQLGHRRVARFVGGSLPVRNVVSRQSERPKQIRLLTLAGVEPEGDCRLALAPGLAQIAKHPAPVVGESLPWDSRRPRPRLV